MSSHAKYKSLPDLLDARANLQSNDIAYIYLNNGEDEEARISFKDLRSRALMIATALIRCSQPGDRALLLYSPGLEYIAAFLGCLYARVIAVPAYPPNGRRSLPRLESVAIDAAPKIAMFDQSTRCRIDCMKVKPVFLESLAVLVTDEISPASEIADSASDMVESTDIAFLQYTSGSTGLPKGVILTHANLLCNQQMISGAFAHSELTRVCSWLPPYHDMGLIGTILQPLYLGVPSILMPPQAFLQKPLLWLAAISKFRATTSGAPNFAYDFCVDKIEEESMEGLDLSCWDLAFNGAEPVRAETMDRFAKKFASFGFRHSAFFPCYGLAEATLIVAGGEKRSEPRVQAFSKRALEANLARSVASLETAERKLVSCGSPIGQELRIVDPNTLLSCETGTTGEIWVRGENVAKGYWLQSDQTRETFQAQLKEEDGTKPSMRPWLRTGDLGFYEEGEIFVTGRLKDLIIIRGRNHYPNDLEQTAKEAHLSVRRGNSAAFSFEGEGQERLVLVQEIERGSKSAAAEAAKAIREGIAEEHELTVYEILIVRLGAIPLTSSGKVRRRQCRQLYLEGKLGGHTAITLKDDVLSKEAGRPPDSSTEKQIAQIWSQQLGLDHVSANDNFFQLGGDSLAGTQIAFSLQETFGVEFPPEILYENQTVELLATAIEQRVGEQKAKIDTYAAERGHAASQFESETTISLKPVDGDEFNTSVLCSTSFPLSHQQRRVWFLSKIDPASADYHIPVVLQLKGKLDLEALVKRLEVVSARHEILRAVIGELDGEPHMKILNASRISFEYCDLSNLNEDQKQLDYERSKAEIASLPFDLNEGPLWRVQLMRIDNEEYRFFLTAHHLISDGWSIVRWVREIFDTLAIDTVQTVSNDYFPPCWSYHEYVAWQQEQMEKDTYRAKLDWWASLLKGSRPFQLSPESPDLAKPNSEFPVCEATLPPGQLYQIKRLASENKTTLFVVLLAVFKILLRRHSGQDAVNVGYPAANRSCPRSQDALGFYVNTLVARTTFSIEVSRFTEALAETKRVVSGGLARQDVSFDDVLKELQLSGSGGRNALFQVFFNLLSLPINEGMKEAAARGLEVELAEEPVWGSKFDLSLYARECKSGLRLSLLFDVTLFSVARVQEMLDQYCLLLRQVVADPQYPVGSYTLVTSRAQLLLSIPDEMPEAKSLDDLQPPFMLFEEQASKCPHAIALVDGEDRWTYDQLNERANRIAHSLIKRRIGTEDVVSIWAEHNAWLICMLLGIHKAGAAFAIFDPDHPVNRQQKCIEIVKPKLLLCVGNLEGIPEEIVSLASKRDLEIFDSRKTAIGLRNENHVDVSSSNPGRNVAANDLAYLAFTSGTTGSPLCIEGTHAPLAHFLNWYSDELGLGDTAKENSTRFSMLSGLAHDPLLRDIFAPLATGNTLCIPSQELFDQPSRLASWLLDSGIEIAHLTPALWEFIASAADGLSFEDLKYTVFSGDILLAAHLQALHKLTPNAIAINGYGATETPQLASFRRIDIREPASSTPSQPIGSRGGENRIKLLNSSDGEAAPGELAEICVESKFLARAYRTLERGEEIGERFSSEASESMRIYRTGDLGRYDLHGNIYFEKRKDRQVSIHGFRVELSEIESAIQSHPQVDQCAAILQRVKAQQNSILAYYTANRGLKEGELLAHLADRLLGYMLPTKLVCLETFPLNSNGKTDYARLRSFAVETATTTSRFEPQSEIEAKLAAICSRILDVSEIDLELSYSQLGGSSIDAVKISIEIEREFSVQPSLTDLFRGRTLASLATWIENEAWLRRNGEHEQNAPLGDEASGRETILL